ncbi:flagellar biosynthetic protein FliR [Rhodovulum bhavnagarense]|uniref:Flagellar biosynthetic protein FliR n=1 Tax=Rhodovulum bhavnagarense TaxID=992286 RepID=A0A4R2RD73_9RHOB|nr:flagellar biosynthetic protein FliR [Rhodovulum bhavnagarense]TCP61390.1 flagellar biosynthetic protein FliR [Rhodovulum bhavnagarense]
MGNAADIASGIPGLDLPALFAQALQLLFSMLRIGAFLIASPLFGARYVPLQVRIIASVILALPAMSLYTPPPVGVLASLEVVPLVVVEICIGAAAGTLLSVIFGAAAIAGDRIANTAGLGFASQIDPAAGTNTPVVSQIFTIFLLVVFMSEDGHLAALQSVLESYRTLPPGQATDLATGAAKGLEAAGLMFLAGAQLMMPAVAVLLLVNVVVGVVTRSAPQLNIFSVGFPLTLLVSVGLLYIGAPTMGRAFSALSEESLSRLVDLLGGLAGG